MFWQLADYRKTFYTLLSHLIFILPFSRGYAAGGGGGEAVL